MDGPTIGDVTGIAREVHASRRIAGRRLLDADDLVRIEERLDAEAAARRVYRAIERLSEADRAVLELVNLDGLDVTEAAALGIRPVSARVRLPRARRRLTEELKADRDEPTRPAPGDDRRTEGDHGGQLRLVRVLRPRHRCGGPVRARTSARLPAAAVGR